LTLFQITPIIAPKKVSKKRKTIQQGAASEVATFKHGLKLSNSKPA
jgi:hypothetical protein